jgi:hypothetical protein
MITAMRDSRVIYIFGIQLALTAVPSIYQPPPSLLISAEYSYSHEEITIKADGGAMSYRG